MIVSHGDIPSLAKAVSPKYMHGLGIHIDDYRIIFRLYILYILIICMMIIVPSGYLT